jgi:hypothetical protein
MAVRADELALRQLVQDRLTAPTPDHRADLGDLVISGEMVPVHDERRKRVATICARTTELHGIHPYARGDTPDTYPFQPGPLASLCVVTPVIRTPALAAIRELAGERAMELSRWLRLSAHRAASIKFVLLVAA